MQTLRRLTINRNGSLPATRRLDHAEISRSVKRRKHRLHDAEVMHQEPVRPHEEIAGFRDLDTLFTDCWAWVS
jgi:hypothetical protein